MMKNYGNMAKKNWNSTVDFFVNPPEGAEHGLKLIQLKIWHHICFKNFWKEATFMLGQKNFQVKINSSINFVIFLLPDLHRY